MSEANRKEVSFKVSPRTMRMLGRQNVSNQHVAIIELIKNAYDADATDVTVTFSNNEKGSLQIVIQDNGSGMNEQTITSSWLTIGTDYKEREPLSRNGRIRTGAKGIGRFALDRLGHIGIIETFVSTEGIRIVINWDKYDDTDLSFETITHELEIIQNPDQKQGTTITILALRDQWTEEDYLALHDDLIFLIPPIDNYYSSFSILLQIDEYSELSGPIKPLARAIAEYELIISMSKDGLIRHTLKHQSGDVKVQELHWRDLVPPSLFDMGPSCGPVKATILFYLRGNSEVKLFDYTVTDLRRYLDTFRGIRLYRDGFHIKPYGSKGDDWLGLDGRKQRSPEGVGQDIGRYHVSNNQLIGTVEVSRTENPQLQDKTSREGLIENEAFKDLKIFLMSGLRFLEVERQLRVQGIETKQEEPLQLTVQSIVSTIEKLEIIRNEGRDNSDLSFGIDTSKADNTVIEQEESTTNSLKDLQIKEEIPEVTDTIKRLEASKKAILLDNVVTELVHQKETLQQSATAQLQEIQLLRALATLGIALAAFAHEVMRDIHSILDETYLLRRRLDTIFPDADPEIKQRLEIAIASTRHMESWSDFILERVKKNRREEQEIKLKEFIADILKSFESLFDHQSIKMEIDIKEDIPLFKAFPIDLEAIFINLLTNAVKALGQVPLSNRKIKLQAKYRHNSQQLEIILEDSGPGISKQELPNPKLGPEQLLEPFVSGRNRDGTGMGLAVINKVLHDHRGKISIHAHGALGGASFNILLPLKLFHL